MCDKCGSHVIATFVLVMGFFFFHFYKKLLPTNLNTLLNWRVLHMVSVQDIKFVVHANPTLFEVPDELFKFAKVQFI
jgi:hypothetical protein